MTGFIFLVILVVIAVVLIGMYNSLVQLRVRSDSAWSDIDVQLKRRHDLIPNLVETVKGYAAHEKGTFENIAKFRSRPCRPPRRRQGCRRESTDRRAQEPVRGGGKLSAAPGLGAIHATAKFAQPDGRCDSKCAPLLQRRGARPEHEDSIVPDQYSGGDVRLPAKQFFEAAAPIANRCGEVLS